MSVYKVLSKKDCKNISKAKNKLRKVYITILDLPDGESSKKLHGKDRVFRWYVSTGLIKIKVQENSPPLYISHTEDFRKYFPDIDFHSWQMNNILHRLLNTAQVVLLSYFWCTLFPFVFQVFFKLLFMHLQFSKAATEKCS